MGGNARIANGESRMGRRYFGSSFYSLLATRYSLFANLAIGKKGTRTCAF